MKYAPLTDADAPKSQWRPWHLLVLIVLVAATAIILMRNRTATDGNVGFQRDEGAIFGTFYHATYRSSRSLKADIEAELQRVDRSLSMFNPTSTISRINSGTSDATDSLLQYVITLSQRVSESTNGAFDITVAPLVNAWGFGYKSGTLPDSAAVDSLRALVGYRHIALTEDGRIEKDIEGVVLDCSAVAKGFGVDRVAQLLRGQGINDFMVEIGGELVVSGTNPDGQLWRVGVNKPVDDATSTSNELEAVLPLTNCAMATSGNYRNFYITDDGRRISHTIDPHTGRPAQHSLLSATVIAPTCAEADAFATAFMVMGLDSAKALLESQRQLQVYFIYDHDGEDLIYSTVH